MKVRLLLIHRFAVRGEQFDPLDDSTKRTSSLSPNHKGSTAHAYSEMAGHVNLDPRRMPPSRPVVDLPPLHIHSLSSSPFQPLMQVRYLAAEGILRVHRDVSDSQHKEPWRPALAAQLTPPALYIPLMKLICPGTLNRSNQQHDTR